MTGLLKGATQALAAAGIEGEQVEVVSVPGAFEIRWPVRPRPNGLIATPWWRWAVIRGGTRILICCRRVHPRHW